MIDLKAFGDWNEFRTYLIGELTAWNLEIQGFLPNAVGYSTYQSSEDALTIELLRPESLYDPAVDTASDPKLVLERTDVEISYAKNGRPVVLDMDAFVDGFIKSARTY